MNRDLQALSQDNRRARDLELDFLGFLATRLENARVLPAAQAIEELRAASQGVESFEAWSRGHADLPALTRGTDWPAVLARLTEAQARPHDDSLFEALEKALPGGDAAIAGLFKRAAPLTSDEKSARAFAEAMKETPSHYEPEKNGEALHRAYDTALRMANHGSTRMLDQVQASVREAFGRPESAASLQLLYGHLFGRRDYMRQMLPLELFVEHLGRLSTTDARHRASDSERLLVGFLATRLRLARLLEQGIEPTATAEESAEVRALVKKEAAAGLQAIAALRAAALPPSLLSEAALARVSDLLGSLQARGDGVGEGLYAQLDQTLGASGGAIPALLGQVAPAAAPLYTGPLFNSAMSSVWDARRERASAVEKAARAAPLARDSVVAGRAAPPTSAPAPNSPKRSGWRAWLPRN